MKKFLVLSLALASAASFAVAGDDAKKMTNDAACCAEGCSLVSVYDKISTALAADDLKAAQTANKDLACWAECADNKEVTTQIEAFGKAATIADARKIFKTLSAALIPLADKDATTHFVMYCPMADAEWMQTTDVLANPYYGKKMLRCGEVKRKVEAPQT